MFVLVPVVAMLLMLLASSGFSKNGEGVGRGVLVLGEIKRNCEKRQPIRKKAEIDFVGPCCRLDHLKIL
jgi:hypothetical protein